MVIVIVQTTHYIFINFVLISLLDLIKRQLDYSYWGACDLNEGGIGGLLGNLNL